jgi:hypothetical protein
MQTYSLDPDHNPRPHNSAKGFYRLTPGMDRTIGVVAPADGAPAPNPPALDPTQSVHDSVRRRWDEYPGYRPKSLRDYFRLIGDPRAS